MFRFDFFLTSKKCQDIDNDSVDSGDDNITCWIESADQCKATSRQIWTNSLNYTE